MQKGINRTNLLEAAAKRQDAKRMLRAEESEHETANWTTVRAGQEPPTLKPTYTSDQN